MSEGTSVAVPGLAGLAGGLRRTKAAMPSFGGKGYLSFGKDGKWSFGKNTAVDGERVVLNITTLKSGYVCWTNYDPKERRKNEKLGEEMRLTTMGGVDPSTLPDLGWEWKQQQSVEGRFLDGDREEFNYTASSLGGLEAMTTVIDAILGRIEDGEQVYLFPVVVLSSDWYEHRQYGKTYKPVLEIEAWADVDGVIEGAKAASKRVEKAAETTRHADPEPEQEAEPERDEGEEPPVRRRRR